MPDNSTIQTDILPTSTLEQLTQQVANLQVILTSIESKLPFENMAAITLIADDSNLKSVTQQDGSAFFEHQIKIDHPLSNNNPKAIVLAMNQADPKNIASVNVFFNQADSFWYISTPDLKEMGFEVGVIANPDFVVGQPELTVLKGTDFQHTQGIAYVGPRWPVPGQRFSVLIFTPPLKQIKTKDVVDNPPVVVKGPTISFTGDWDCKFVSTAGSSFEGKLSLVINEGSATGTLAVSDNSNGAVVGTFANSVLSLSRDTGLETVQVMQLNVIDTNHFSGTYLNHGKFADSGTIELSR